MSEGQIEVAGQQPASSRSTALPGPRPRATPGVYRRHRPESTALYEVVRDNIETLFGAIDDGGLAVRIPKHDFRTLSRPGSALLTAHEAA
jgi:hypothetical protein